MARLTASALVSLALLGACAQSSPAMPYVVRGTLRDATTSAPISRENVYVHFFCDDAGFQASLELEDESEFEVALPTPNVRIRVSDRSHSYAFLTETFTLTAPRVERDIRLRPTGYVLLRGRVVDATTGAPIAPPRRALGAAPTVGDSGPLFTFKAEADGFSAGMVGTDDDGRFELKVPRAVLEVLVVNTALAPVEPTIDLSKAEGPAFDYVLRMR